MSAWGVKSNWYLNIQKNDPIYVETGHERYVPSFQILPLEEARRVLELFSSKHKTQSRMFVKSFLRSKGNEMKFEDIAKLLPIISFEPKRSETEIL